ncbi:hypothetical protein BJX63DRAFT_429895 [Aspergillus granulosus]|uniref:Zn(2)-C6 fungal-type domain-containing protein n=1 Tax=Aspergillus granulosus TaxID=176169 RepID=A0ABR4HR04_9EURO
MNHLKEGEFPLDKLPKSVKVRSTCNACQEAKIRCSHDRPSCKRCQKHNTACVYSISRRLGRPVKRKDDSADTSLTEQAGSDNRPNKRARGPKKKKATKEPLPDPGSRGRSNSRDDKPLLEAVPFDHTQLGDLAVEDANLQTPTLMDMVTSAPFSFADYNDMASDNWLHEFMSNPFADDPTQHCEFLGSFEGNTVKADNAPPYMSVDPGNLPAQSDGFSDGTSETQNPLSPWYYAGVNTCFTNSEPFLSTMQGGFQGAPAGPGHFEQHTNSWQQPLSGFSGDFLMESPSLFPQVTALEQPHDYVLSDDDFKARANGPSNTLQCQAHEHAFWDLNRMNICAPPLPRLLPDQSGSPHDCHRQY